jgi:3-oxoacyl-[acyl-carrier-protein] synthase-1
MQPLVLTCYTLTTSLGEGVDDHVQALTSHRSGLAPCSFETARLDTWTGQVADVHLPALAPSLSRFDCRNNRLT